jgi:hypothetical protein
LVFRWGVDGQVLAVALGGGEEHGGVLTLSAGLGAALVQGVSSKRVLRPPLSHNVPVRRNPAMDERG